MYVDVPDELMFHEGRDRNLGALLHRRLSGRSVDVAEIEERVGASK